MHIDLARYTRYLTYFYLVAVPGLVEGVTPLGMHDTARALQALLGCVAVSAWAQTCSFRVSKQTVTMVALGACWTSLTTLSVWQAHRPLYAATEASLWLSLIALAWVFSTTRLDTLTKEVPYVIAAAVFAMVLPELMQIGFAWLSSHPLDAGYIGRGHASVRHFNHVQTMALIMGAMVIWYSTAPWLRWVAWFGVGFGLALVWLTGARSTLLALTIVGVIFLALVPHTTSKWFIRLGIMCIAGIVAYQVFYVLLPYLLDIKLLIDWSTLNQREHISSMDTRLTHWTLALNMSLQRPWTGWGGLHYATQNHVDAAHPHNIIMQWGAEWGWISVLLAIFTLGSCLLGNFKSTWQRFKGKPWELSPLVTAAWMATIAGLFDAMLSGTLTMPVSQVFWMFCLGISNANNFQSNNTTRLVGSKTALLTSIVFSTIMVALMISTYTETLIHSQTEPSEPRTNKPRLWLIGNIVM